MARDTGSAEPIPLASIPAEFLTPQGSAPGGEPGADEPGEPGPPTLVWDAPSLWVERAPVLLANDLQLWAEFGLPFKQVKLRVNNGGPQLLAAVEAGTAHVGEIGIFPFVQWRSSVGPGAAGAAVTSTAATVSAGPHSARITGTTFIQQLEHYLVASVARAPEVESIADLAHHTARGQSTAGAAAEAAGEDRRRSVGILSQGSCDSFLLEHALQAEATSPAAGEGKCDHSARLSVEVSVVELREAYGKLSALDRADACFLAEPALSAAERAGSARVLKRLGDYFPNGFQWNALFASDAMLRAESRPLLLRLMAVYKAAVDRLAEWRDAQRSAAAMASAGPGPAGPTPAVQETQAALDAIASEHFGVSPEVFRSALLRGSEHWALDWRKLDMDGVETCLRTFRFGRTISADEFSRDFAVAM